ncbi:MAG TPA: hypothetical protein VGM37_11940 [Armatimonadota bacterium]|jgi:hypothetical protein
MIARRIWTGALAAALLLLCCGSAWAAKDERVTVTILPTSPTTWSAGVLFPGAVDKATASAAVEDLMKRAGWQMVTPTVDTIPARGRFPAQTSAQFDVGTLFPNGEFPLEAFVLAFRKWGGVNVMFAHGGAFQYHGQPHYENADAAVDAAGNESSFTLRVRVKNRAMESFSLTPPLQPKGPAAATRRRPMSIGWWLLAAACAGGIAWLAVFALASSRKHGK